MKTSWFLFTNICYVLFSCVSRCDQEKFEEVHGRLHAAQDCEEYMWHRFIVFMRTGVCKYTPYILSLSACCLLWMLLIISMLDFSCLRASDVFLKVCDWAGFLIVGCQYSMWFDAGCTTINWTGWADLRLDQALAFRCYYIFCPPHVIQSLVYLIMVGLDILILLSLQCDVFLSHPKSGVLMAFRVLGLNPVRAAINPKGVATGLLSSKPLVRPGLSPNERDMIVNLRKVRYMLQSSRKDLLSPRICPTFLRLNRVALKVLWGERFARIVDFLKLV
jgi:hypothetical protein